MTDLKLHPLRLIRLVFVFLAVLFLFVASHSALAKQDPSGLLRGKVIDSQTGAPIADADVLLLGHNALVHTGADGWFSVLVHTDTRDTLVIAHPAYKTQYHVLRPPVDVTDPLTLRLVSRTYMLRGEEYIVRYSDTTFVDPEPWVDLTDLKLQRALGQTVAATLEEQAGVDARSFGPNPARPVLRGMGGGRVLIFEDEMPVGDLSATSYDHAVAIDPVVANEITVLRAVQALRYGPLAPGGVVLVDRNVILDQAPADVAAEFSAGFETVNGGQFASGDLAWPTGPVVLHLNGNLRGALEMQTPDGKIDNTKLQTINVAGGASVLPEWGLIGAGVTVFESEYGLPDVNGTGRAPDEVEIQLERTRYDLRARADLELGALNSMELAYSATRYRHTEYEYGVNTGPELEQVGHEVRLEGTLGEQFGFNGGAVGVNLGYRERTAYEPGTTPDYDETTAGLYVQEYWHGSGWSIHAGLRGDLVRIQDAEEDFYQRFGQGWDLLRTFTSGSVYVGRWLAEGAAAHLELSRTFRAPRIEEQVGYFPHLAAYADEFGYSEFYSLGNESSWGLELGLDIDHEGVIARTSAYANLFDNYIDTRPIRPNHIGYPGFVEMRTEEIAALYTGIETDVQVQVAREWTINGAGGFVWARSLEEERALEDIPPFNGRLGVTWTRRGYSVTGRAVGAARQWHTTKPGVWGDAFSSFGFGDPTAAWLRFDLLGSVRLPFGGTQHTLTVALLNLADTSYREHLSFIHALYPAQGRNLRVTYRVEL